MKGNWPLPCVDLPDPATHYVVQVHIVRVTETGTHRREFPVLTVGLTAIALEEAIQLVINQLVVARPGFGADEDEVKV